MTDRDPLTALVDSIAGGRASGVRRDGGRVGMILDVGGLGPADRDALVARLETALTAAAGIDSVAIAQTAERVAPRLLAVASGKGGVGKSTLSANLAVAMVRAGHPTGLIDADIQGPSQPTLLGAAEARPEARDKRLVPVATPSGVPMLSMGQLVEPGRALAWRGPMLGGALGQLVDGWWDGIRTIVVDMPPGTGDVQLTMVQKHPPAGALIVSTPQDLALIDARRAMDLFAKANVPVIGMVENMAGYICPHCGEVSEPFGRGGVEAEAGALGLPFLGRIPLDRSILDASEAGVPPALGEGAVATAFAKLAAAVLARLDTPGRSPVS